MKKLIKLFLLIILFVGFKVYSQNYIPLNYFFNGTPTYGIKIKTNIPFQHGVSMPTIMLEGFEYNGGNVIDIKLNWYVYNGVFIRANASSSGSYTPGIKLANDNGKISIYIDDRAYYTRFNIRVFSWGKGEISTMFDNWTAVDEPISGTNIKTVLYKNSFTNNIVINTNGNVGIGTTIPDEKLSVNGNIHTKEVRVDLIGWSDFVFDNDYKLPSLQEVENHIKENGHLKDIPSAEEVAKDGIFLGEMDSKLLLKIEELTLYTINQEKRIESLELKNENLEKENETLKLLLADVELLKKELKNLKQN